MRLCFLLTVSRLEEKESEFKKEYNKLHERYTEVYKTFMKDPDSFPISSKKIKTSVPKSVRQIIIL